VELIPIAVRATAVLPCIRRQSSAGPKCWVCWPQQARPWNRKTPLLALTEKRPQLSERGAYLGSLLLAQGADPDRADRKSETAVHKASEQAAGAALLQLLLRRGAPVAVRDQLQRTPLHRAAFESVSGNGVQPRLFPGLPPPPAMTGG
jgi:ankyrin repeat protein